MFLGITLAGFVVLVLWYAIRGRAWLQEQSWAKGFFAWIEPLEIGLFKKSETILIGRLLWLGGLIVTFYDGLAVFAQSLDLTPLTTRLFDALHIPTDMRGMAGTAFITGLGYLISWMRKRVSKPIELVALPDKVVAENPRVAEAVAMADATKTEAVQAVVEAKAA
jgi:hypothetical protein